MNSRGQAFESFRLLIGAIIAFAVLMIIIGAVSYFDGLRTSISARRIADGLNNSIQSPNGETVIVKDVRIQKGETFSKTGLSRSTGIAEECFEFQASPGIDSIVSWSPDRFDPKSIEFTSEVQTNVYFKCSQGINPNCTRAQCLISFGKKP